MYQIVGIKSDGRETMLFTWNRDPFDGIERARQETIAFNQPYVRYRAECLDPS